MKESGVNHTIFELAAPRSTSRRFASGKLRVLPLGSDRALAHSEKRKHGRDREQRLRGAALAGSNRPLIVTSGTGVLTPGRLAMEKMCPLPTPFPR
jgi:hypothetical protein